MIDRNSSLAQAYDYCRKIARSHYENFPVGSILIPKKLRKHFFALYAFMRAADDFADLPSRSKSERLELLRDWRKNLDDILAGEKTENPIFLALGNTIHECKLPPQPFYKLLEAFVFDAKGAVKFETFDDLRWYTARSAEPVGELVLALFGYKDEELIRLSNEICTGLQVLNFIQDIREDLGNKRYYYPQEDCRKFGTGIESVGRSLSPPADGRTKSPPNWKEQIALLSLFELDRVESLLNNGVPLAESVRGRLRYELRAVIHAAREMVMKIRNADGDTYSQRLKLTKREHIFILLQSMFFSVNIRWSKHEPRITNHDDDRISRNAELLLEENLSPEQGVRSNFFYSFSLLPRDERMAMQSVYEFCRYTDDLVDEDIPLDIPGIDFKKEAAIEKKRIRLNWWRAEVEKCYAGTSKHPLLFSLHKVISRFKIPKQYFLTLIDGVEMDLVKDRYENFEELKEYCYAVASIVGLITIEIFGYKFEKTKEYAVDLGIALQLTNILRDVKKDAEMGRIYLPKKDMRRFGVSEKDILSGNYNIPFINLMKFETARARKYYHEARQKLGKHERFTLFAAQIMDAIYARLLRKIELAEFNVFQKRITVSTPHKVLIAFRFWFSSVIFRERGA